MRATPDPLAGPVICDGCLRAVWWPRWPADGNGQYYSLCDLCYHRRQREFTIESALAEASAILGSLSIIRPRVQIGGGR